jgi:TonB family protein
MIAATLAHAAVLGFWPELHAADFTIEASELTAITMPPEITLPPPPEQIRRPASPVVTNARIDENITIPTTNLDEYVNQPLPAPRVQEQVDLSSQPTFTPMEVGPEIRNRDEFQRLLEAAYPPMLRDAGISGEVRLHFFINGEGVVEQVRLATGAVHEQFNDAALGVAPRLQFTPALNRGEPVPVWVELSIVFEPR